MTLQQKTAKSIAWSAIDQVGNQAIYFVLFLVLARLLQPEAFGLVSLAGVFISFMMVFADQGLSDAIVQRQELEPEHLDTVFWLNLGISILLTALTFIVAGPVSSFFKQPQLMPIVACLSLNFLCAGLSSVQQSLLRRQLAFKTLAMRSLLGTTSGGIVGIVMAYLGWGVWSLVAQQLVGRVVTVLALWWLSDWRPGFRVSAKHFKDLFSFGISTLGGSILVFFSVRSDDFLIGYFLGPEALGYYTVAYRLLTAMTQILSTTIRKVVLPMFSRLQEETEIMQRALFKATQLVSLITFPAFLGVATLAPELIQNLFGPQWLPSAPVMQLLALSGIPQSIFNISGIVIVAMGKPTWILAIMFLSTMVNVIGFLIAVQWGIVAVAASFAIRAYLLSPVQIGVIYKLLHFKLATYFYQFVAPLAASLLMAIAIFGAKSFLGNLLNSPALLASCITIGSAVYTAAILLIAPQLFWQAIEFISMMLKIPQIKKT